ncbi:GNAT family N-acetyltransferase, partial [Neisseria sp. P0015.S004]
LLQHWQNAVQQHGANRLLLEVRSSNETAQQLYRKHGFQTCSLRKNYYALPDGGSEDAVLMEKSC